MNGLLNRLRNKSEEEKKSLAFSISIIITACIFIVWLLTFQFNLGLDNKTQDVEGDASSNQNSSL